MNTNRDKNLRKADHMTIDRRRLLVGASQAAGATALGCAMPSAASAQPGGSAGPFTTAERDRRWQALRAMMSAQGVDCLVVPNLTGDFTLHYAQYVTNAPFNGPGVAVLPAQGEAAAIGISPSPGAWARALGRRGEPLGTGVVDLIDELGYGSSTIGVVGTANNVFGLNEFVSPGLMLYSVWSEVLSAFPDADFVDVTEAFADVNLVKGPEEIAVFEKAALLGEQFHRMLLENARPGVTDRQFRSRIAEFMILNGATTDVQALEMQPGPIEVGHIINSEYGIEAYGGYAQVTLCISIGEPSALTRELHDVARAALAAGLETVKPGVTFGEAFAPMEEIVRDAGYWHGFPVLHSMRPVVLAGPVGIGQPIGSYADPLGADKVLKPGMSISFEPGARIGRSDQVKIGSSAVVTDNGVKLFNTLGLSLQQV